MNQLVGIASWRIALVTIPRDIFMLTHFKQAFGVYILWMDDCIFRWVILVNHVCNLAYPCFHTSCLYSLRFLQVSKCTIHLQLCWDVPNWEIFLYPLLYHRPNSSKQFIVNSFISWRSIISLSSLVYSECIFLAALCNFLRNALLCTDGWDTFALYNLS